MPDIATAITQGLIAPLVQGLGQVADAIGTGLAARSTRTSRGAAQKHGCGCETATPCQCTCCVVDADVVIYGFLGETRIASFVVTNDRIRDKKITLALGAFTTRAGKPAPVKGVLLAPTEFELAPCASRNVVMAIATEPLGRPGAPNEPIPDVDDCTVYYSDLRIDGCEMRPLRIAVAILPRDCGAYKIHCHSCCC
jgi:hypothetical protein